MVFQLRPLGLPWSITHAEDRGKEYIKHLCLVYVPVCEVTIPTPGWGNVISTFSFVINMLEKALVRWALALQLTRKITQVGKDHLLFALKRGRLSHLPMHLMFNSLLCHLCDCCSKTFWSGVMLGIPSVLLLTNRVAQKLLIQIKMLLMIFLASSNTWIPGTAFLC